MFPGTEVEAVYWSCTLSVMTRIPVDLTWWTNLFVKLMCKWLSTPHRRVPLTLFPGRFDLTQNVSKLALWIAGKLTFDIWVEWSGSNMKYSDLLKNTTCCQLSSSWPYLRIVIQMLYLHKHSNCLSKYCWPSKLILVYKLTCIFFIITFLLWKIQLVCQEIWCPEEFVLVSTGMVMLEYPPPSFCEWVWTHTHDNILIPTLTHHTHTYTQQMHHAILYK